jgi:rhamnosyltransferase
MDISVIIPTFNAEHYLPALLENLARQTITFELIIIDSSSTDSTLQIAKQYTDHIISITQADFDHGGTRTKAAKTATGELIIFLTQDALPYTEDALEKLLIPLASPEVAAVYGRQLPYEQTILFGKHLRIFNYPAVSYVRTLSDASKYGIKTAFLSDSFAAYKKSALEKVDWFKNGLIVGEDTHIGAKLLLAGYSIAYASEAQVYHSHSYSIPEEFRRYFDIGVFHTNEYWILEHFGKAEGEGGRYIKSEFSYIVQQKAWFYLPTFFIRNALKYTGYKLGRYYQYLPMFIIKKLSMHAGWWDKQ